MTPDTPRAAKGRVESPILRVQDREGRGPYRPGFSAKWLDDDGPTTLPWWEELGEDMVAAHRQRCAGPYHWGCGFRSGDQLRAWFTPRERGRLARLGFALVRIWPSVVVAETPTQVVFGCSRPLAEAMPRISLASHLAKAA